MRPVRGIGWIQSPPSVEMESVIFEEAMRPGRSLELVVPAHRVLPRPRCHRSHVIEIGSISRRGALPRVVYGSPMRCAPVQIVWVDPAR
jgi:hypothetical protein